MLHLLLLSEQFASLVDALNKQVKVLKVLPNFINAQVDKHARHLRSFIDADDSGNEAENDLPNLVFVVLVLRHHGWQDLRSLRVVLVAEWVLRCNIHKLVLDNPRRGERNNWWRHLLHLSLALSLLRRVLLLSIVTLSSWRTKVLRTTTSIILLLRVIFSILSLVVLLIKRQLLVEPLLAMLSDVGPSLLLVSKLSDHLKQYLMQLRSVYI